MAETARSIVEGKVAQKLQRDANVAKGVKAAIVLELTGDGGGRWVVDFGKTPPTLTEDAATEAPTTISMASEVFVQLTTGELRPESAFLTGKVKVKGDLGVAIKLGQLLV
ncbi:MAG: SCP2 sterol-binding domain-containing protein [Deltaproteobacteria bacterium]|nr:SCP2 sterol-binding domain-containing protein [Deltaproteobacteria bacterium]